MKGAGDDEEHRDEVLAVSITPVYSEEPGHEVSERGPERNEVERGPGRSEHDARLHISDQLLNKGAPRRRGPMASAVVRAIFHIQIYFCDHNPGTTSGRRPVRPGGPRPLREAQHP
ncbi:MAG: hypothetical protein WCJ93_06315 [Methanomicrobiales archaeon]